MKINYNEYKVETLMECRKLTINNLEMLANKWNKKQDLLNRAKKKVVEERNAKNVDRVFKYEQQILEIYYEMGREGNDLVKLNDGIVMVVRKELDEMEEQRQKEVSLLQRGIIDASEMTYDVERWIELIKILGEVER